MVTVLKCILGLFILAGIAISIYGGWELLSTTIFVKNTTERARGTFLGYAREVVVSRSSSPSPTNWGQTDFTDTTSYMSYPEFKFTARDGQTVRVLGKKQHVLERFTPGQKVEIIVSPTGEHRLADFYSLYSLDLCILAFGLCFIMVPAVIWSVVIPSLQTSEGFEAAARFEAMFKYIAETQVGPVRVITILKGCAAFIVLVTAVSLAAGAWPFLQQLRLGPGYDLLEALEQKRFDEARELIARKKGINRKDEYNRSPLLIALEAKQFDVARLLIEAGAEVNVKSRMYMTPLRVAAYEGDLETVRLLLSRGASPDVPEDEAPPAYYALREGHFEIARLILESGCDLKRRYIFRDASYTIGDMTIMANRPELTDIVRRRGGTFTIAN